MNRELSYLVAALRGYFQPSSPLPDASGLDWDRLVELAYTHSVAPLLAQTLINVRPGLHSVLDAAARDDLQFSTDLARLLRAFAAERIPVIPLKGPILSATLYGDAPLRVSSDLDLLVHKGDVLPARRLLHSLGYHVSSALHWSADSACLRSRENQMTFVHQGNHLDLHWRILPPYVPAPFNHDQIWKRARPSSFDGVPATVLSSEDLILFLCAHGAKHLWERLCWICDVARLLQVQPEFDWPYVIEQARQTATTRTLALGLLLALDVLGVEAPDMAQPVMADPRARAMARSIQESILQNAPPADAWASTRFSARLYERPSHLARYVLGSFVQPAEAEFRAVHLPPALFWLYYPIRPLRIAAKSVRRLVRYP